VADAGVTAVTADMGAGEVADNTSDQR
jgi:hypothetical protein